MTDPKELATIVQNMWCNGSVHEPTARAIKDALDAYARILAADTDTREIEERHAARQTGEEPADYSLAFETAHSDRATLLDTNRRLRAELEAAIGERQKSDGAYTLVFTRATEAASKHRQELDVGSVERDRAIADAEESRSLRDLANRSLAARTKEMLAAKERAERLAEGVRLYRSARRSEPIEATETRVQWEIEHGGMVAGEGGK